MSAPEVKLQRIGNSIRATIPKKVAKAASLEEGDIVSVRVEKGTVVLEKKRIRMKNQEMARFYGALKEKTGEVTEWPSSEEIKSIWNRFKRSSPLRVEHRFMFEQAGLFPKLCLLALSA